MSIVVIGSDEQKRIAELVAHAKANVVSWESMKDAALGEGALEVKLSDRKPGFERPPSDHMTLGNVRVAYSHEEQPAGIFRHLSASVQQPGKTPHPVAIAMICEAFGFSRELCEALGSVPPKPADIVARIWLEEFAPGHHAVNVLELIEARS